MASRTVDSVRAALIMGAGTRGWRWPAWEEDLRMPFVVALFVLLFIAPVSAANLIVKDARTLQLDGVTYRLDGIDAPDIDQTCINERADIWACGIEARDALAKLVDGRKVACQDLGPDALVKGRRVGLCSAAEATTSLNRQMIDQGFALNAESGAKARFPAEEATASEQRAGLWRGCFVAPANFRRWDKTAPLLGASCRPDKAAELQALLFPTEAVMPPGCAIKGKFAKRARFTGNVGIYHLQGCRSYASLTKPERWFCSEDDARAAGFRKAYNCRSGKP